MKSLRQFCRVLALIVVGIAVAEVTGSTADAQTFSILHTFTGGSDGTSPYAGVTLDQAGNLYGTTSQGGAGRCGTVYRLQHRNSAWSFLTLYSFHGSDGCTPRMKIVWGHDGGAYGTTQAGGSLNQGTVFELRAPLRTCATSNCPWKETVLYSFQGAPDAAGPSGDPLAFDSSGNFFGTSWGGGDGMCNDATCGAIYELSPSQGGWTETVVHSFPNGNGASPNGVIVGNDGNLYGTVYYNPGGENGSVFQLVRDNGWAFTNIFMFTDLSDGALPYAGVISDSDGNLYGSTGTAGANNAGTVFSLSSGGNFSLLAPLTQPGGQGIFIGPGPAAKLMMDSAGNLFGTTYGDGAFGFGSVFKLTRSGNDYVLSTLHDFTGGADGAFPVSDVVMDAAGNLYGTSSSVVWEITP